MEKKLIKENKSHSYVDGTEVEGTHNDILPSASGIIGEISSGPGNMSGIIGVVSSGPGNMSGISVDIDACEITDDEIIDDE